RHARGFFFTAAQLLRAQVSATIGHHPTKSRTGRSALRAIGLVFLSIILAMVIVPPALAKAKRAQSVRAQQGYQSSERPGYYHGYPLSDWYRDSLSSY